MSFSYADFNILKYFSGQDDVYDCEIYLKHKKDNRQPTSEDV